MPAGSCDNLEYTFSNDLQFGVELNIETNSRNIYKETHQQWCIDRARLLNNSFPQLGLNGLEGHSPLSLSTTRTRGACTWGSRLQAGARGQGTQR